MPLLPIDLQALFTQQGRVGKEQSVQKEATPQAQSLQASQMVKKTEQRDNDVNEAQNADNESERIKMRGGRRQAKEQGRKKEKKDAHAPQPEKSDVVRDPSLGRNIDITS